MQKTVIIEGMHCQHCVSAVQEALSSLPGITEVQVDLASGQAVIQAGSIDDSAVREAIEDIGFDVLEIR